jgi:Ca2+-dependent lipid-binding protein
MHPECAVIDVAVPQIGARDLPVMDRNLQGEVYTDAYVDIKFAHNEQRTQIQRKTLNPVWDEEFKFQV